MKRSAGMFTLIVLLCGFAAHVSVRAAEASPAQPAVWMNHIVMVELHDLPSPYLCDDLWYKFRDVLRSIGARPDWKITTQGCSFNKVGPQGRSPQVELHFYLPEGISGPEARFSDFRAVQKQVMLQPGSAPHALKNSDCDLVRQISDSLLPSLPVQVVSGPVDCGAPGRPQHDYQVAVKALIPVTTGR